MKKLIFSFVLTVGFLFSCGGNDQSIEISNAWIRELPPGLKNTALYLDINNSSIEGEKLVKISSDLTDRIEIHETKIEQGDVGKMVRLRELDIPTNKTTSLKPGGVHIMLLDLNRQLRSGDEVSLNLEFLKSGLFSVKAEVISFRDSNEHNNH